MTTLLWPCTCASKRGARDLPPKRPAFRGVLGKRQGQNGGLNACLLEFDRGGVEPTVSVRWIPFLLSSPSGAPTPSAAVEGGEAFFTGRRSHSWQCSQRSRRRFFWLVTCARRGRGLRVLGARYSRNGTEVYGTVIPRAHGRATPFLSLGARMQSGNNSLVQDTRSSGAFWLDAVY